MDRIILTLDQRDKDPPVEINNRGKYRVRYAVRAVIIAQDGAVPLLHATVRGYYKLPGGRVEAREDLYVALARELQEEIGSKADVTQNLGQVIERRDSQQLKQISYCFKASLRGGDKGQPSFTASEIAEGFEIVWVKDINHAISLVEATADSADISVAFITTRDAAILRAAVLNIVS